MIERPEYDVRYADGDCLQLGRLTRVMGVLNVTPDSFSDGGQFEHPSAAIDAAGAMIEAGAEIVDVGGESTRPGATPVGAAEEAARVLPVIAGIKRQFQVRVSIDSCKAEVAARAIDAGADMVNDVSGLADPGMTEVLRNGSTPVVIMHMRGTPQTMQRTTTYDDLIATVTGFLAERVRYAIRGGLSRDRIVIDPGIGFGKSVAGNLALLERIPELATVGQPILIGVSRKSFIGKVLDLPVDERTEAGLALAAHAAARGAHMIRTHDVAATLRAVRMIDAIRDNEIPEAACSSGVELAG